MRAANTAQVARLTRADFRDRATAALANAPRSFASLDVHTSGEPTRILLDAIAGGPWKSAAEAGEEIQANHDWLRRAATFEPRGHRGMFGAALVPIDRPDCSWGVVFLSPDGYPAMCGHATIGVVTALVELRLVETRGRTASITLDTPAGPILTRVETDRDGAGAVTFRNRPAFVLERRAVRTPGGDPVDAKIAWGGQWYAFVEAEPFGLSIDLTQVHHLVAAAAEVRLQLAADGAQSDPRTGEPVQVGNIVWVAPGEAGARARNVAISPAGAFDRSPCGTGTSARLAVLHAEGALGHGEVFVNEGILGTRFEARIVEEVEVAGCPGVVPEVTGQAWLAGFSEFWIDPTDPLGDGFLPGEGHA